MVDDRPEDIEPSPDPGRAKRAPPTIDLEASEISGATGHADTADTAPADRPARAFRWPSAASISPALIAAVSGASAAALVIAVAWLLGEPAAPPTAPAPAAVNTTALDDLAARIASVEAKTGKPQAAAPDPAAASRIEALEKSLAAQRGEIANLRVQSDKPASARDDANTGASSPSAVPDLSAIEARIAELERTMRAQSAELSQQGARLAETRAAEGRPADDMPLRRVVVAALLDISVRHGDPYSATLAAAKALAPNADALKPLDGFAASGVPSAAALSRELLTLIPKLSAPDNAATSTGTGIVDRLQAGAAKLVRIQRTDTGGNDRGAVVARVTAAALHNDAAEARRELMTLGAADRAAAQGWIDKTEARDAALAAARQFAADAMAALAKPAQ
jgi:hypothetical protein